MKILLTGGCGYIGSHTAAALLDAGYEILIADDFSNSSPTVAGRLRKISGKDFRVYTVDAADRSALRSIFRENRIDCVIHFAGYKAVGESVEQPLKYYCNNLNCTIAVLAAMAEFQVRNIIFSSSATVYGTESAPIFTESAPVIDAVNPYGRTKLMSEKIIEDAVSAYGMSAVLLRYFNPVGAHESGLLGENPNGIPNNLMPYIAQVAEGRLERLTVYGNDYPTPDGTGVRDYIHVCDLAEGHVKAVEYAVHHTGLIPVNLGTGHGTSVLEMLHAFERACGKTLPYVIGPRRPGDLAMYYADPARAEELLHWKAKRTIDDMCRDTWRWQSWLAAHPSGEIEET